MYQLFFADIENNDFVLWFAKDNLSDSIHCDILIRKDQQYSKQIIMSMLKKSLYAIIEIYIFYVYTPWILW